MYSAARTLQTVTRIKVQPALTPACRSLTPPTPSLSRSILTSLHPTSRPHLPPQTVPAISIPRGSKKERTQQSQQQNTSHSFNWQRTGEKLRHYSENVIIGLACTLTGLLLVKLYVVECIRIRGQSMKPTIGGSGSEWVMYEHLLRHYRKGFEFLHHSAVNDIGLDVPVPEVLQAMPYPFKPGDIVISDSVARHQRLIVKRVVGVGGDVLAMQQDDGSIKRVTVPPQHVWLQGDNLSDSADSRQYGPVHEDNIRGRVLYCFQPLKSIKVPKRTLKYAALTEDSSVKLDNDQQHNDDTLDIEHVLADAIATIRESPFTRWVAHASGLAADNKPTSTAPKTTATKPTVKSSEAGITDADASSKATSKSTEVRDER